MSLDWLLSYYSSCKALLSEGAGTRDLRCLPNFDQREQTLAISGFVVFLPIFPLVNLSRFKQ